jgi:type IV pilus assembly protein PilN
MPRINLLPWRNEERKERKLAFFVAIGGATLAAGVVAFAGYLMLNSMIEGQIQRNDKLRAEIRLLDKQIEEINNLESSKQKFIARMEIIEKLQRSRPEIVHLFDEIVKQLPEGVYLTGVKQQDKRLRFDGVAQSSTRVSTFMRNIDASEWMRGADLEIVQSAAGNTPGQSFTLYADQVSNVSDDDKGGPKSKKLASAGGNK